ncbi:MAG: sugar ABC transporter substrate-binding protein [Candidatus Hydrogenedentes bacterium]|nr:sugar ABC transporter substrate-binding protein [Candidatus Hydrogenedentota bacterium]
MKQAILIILAIVVLFVVLGRLHGEHESDGDAISLEFWCYGTGGATNPGAEFWDDAARRFAEQHPGVRVRVMADMPHGPYLSMLTTRFVGGNPPDVMITDDGYLGQLAHEGLIASLEGYIQSDPGYHSEHYAPSMVRDGYIGDERYGIPWYGGYGYLAYRTDLFQEAGVRPPASWAELIAICRQLQEKAGLDYPFAMEVRSAFFMMPWIWQNGGRIMSDDLRTVMIGEAASIEAVQFVHDLIHKHKVMDPTVATGTKVVDLWSTGKAAFIIQGSWNAGRNDTLYPQWQGKWAAAPLPAGKEAVSFFGGQHLIMSRASEHPDLAWAFMSFITSTESQLRHVEMTGQPPGNLEVCRAPGFAERFPYFAALPEAVEQGRNMPFVPCFTRIWYELFQSNVMEVVMSDPEADVAGVMRDVARDMQAVTDDYWATHEYYVQGRPDGAARRRRMADGRVEGWAR